MIFKSDTITIFQEKIDSLEFLVDSIKSFQANIQDTLIVSIPNTVPISNSGSELLNLPFYLPLGISLLAVYITYLMYKSSKVNNKIMINQLKETRKHNIVLTTPLLRLDSGWNIEKKIFYIKLYNHGTGPAIIISQEMYWRGQITDDLSKIPGIFDDLIKNLYYNNPQPLCTYFPFNKDEIMGSNEDIELLRIDFALFIKEHMDSDYAYSLIADFIIKHLQINIKFKNLYDIEQPPIQFPTK